MKIRNTLRVAILCASTIATGSVDAGERRFTYVYEATTLAKGEREYEQWVTWKTAKETDRDFDRFDFRHELEWGVTDNFQLAFYFADWRYDADKRKGDFRDIALEAIYNFTSPVTDPVGLSLYGEIQIGDEKLELEGKLILEKDFGSVVLAYNAILEAEWEGSHLEEDKGEFAQTVGLSYQFSPRFLAGIELLHEIEIPDWRGARGKGLLYLGPNFSYRTEKWWATLTPLFQVSDVEDEPDFQMRLIVGFSLGE